MAVLAADVSLGARRRTPPAEDAYGTPIAGELGPMVGPLPGRVVARPAVDANLDTGPGTWVLAVDASLWPLAAGDEVIEHEGHGRTWTATGAALRTSAFDPSIDYIRVECSQNAPLD